LPYVYREIQIAQTFFETYLDIKEPKVLIDTTKKEVSIMLSEIEISLENFKESKGLERAAIFVYFVGHGKLVDGK
jgi:hypothetical protein